MAGLLDFEDPQMRLAMGLLAAAGPTARPMSFGQRLMGVMQQQDAYKRQQEDRKAAEEERQLKKRYTDAQISEIEAHRQERLAAAAKEQLRQKEAQRIMGVLQEAMSNRQLVPGQSGSGPRPDASMQQAPIDPRQLLTQGVPAELALKFMEAPNWGRPEVKGALDVATPTGQPAKQLYDNYGGNIGSPRPSAVEMKLANLGDKQQPYNPFALDPSKPMPIGMSPQDREQLSISRGNLAVNQARLAHDKSQPTDSKEPLVQIIDPVTKTPVWARRSDAVGKTPAGAGTAYEAKETGRKDLDREVTRLAEVYKELDKQKGITNTDRGWWDNVWSSAGTSGLGQVAGRTFGTVPQSNRDIINMSRPLLMMAILKATGATSARQFDSNKELQIWLDTASDPSKGYQANMEALNNIATKYGSGPIVDLPKRGGSVTDEADAILGIGGK